MTALLTLFAALLAVPGANAEPLRLSDFDKQAHVVVGFQATTTASTVLEFLGQTKGLAASNAAIAVMVAELAKEYLFDAQASFSDILATALGAGPGALLMALWPEHSELTLEPEGGLLYCSSQLLGARSSAPPDALLINAQDTFYYRRTVGLHLFSGGFMSSRSDPTGRRLMFGGGLRVAPFGGSGLFRFWAGADYGFLLFSAAPVTDYTSSAYVPFFSTGLAIHPSWTRLFAAAQLSYIPYAGHRLIATGIQGGWTF